jgi:hypothetical protein
MCFLFADCCAEPSEKGHKDRLEYLDLDSIMHEFEIIRNTTTMRKKRVIQDHLDMRAKLVEKDTNGTFYHRS